MKIDDVFSDKSILERKQSISSEKLNNMSMEELIHFIFLLNIFRDVFMNEEIEKAKQGQEKMKLQCESSGSICIDTSKMGYVEE